jgi:hypothetical protein
MSATRRSFLTKAAAAAVVASASSLKTWAKAEERALTTAELIGRETMESATPQTFEQWIGGIFKIKLRGISWGTLQLAKVESEMFPHPPKANGFSNQPPASPNISPSPGPALPTDWGPGTVPEVQSTILWFKRAHSPLPQDVWTVEHDWLGTFDLLLAPDRPRRGTNYCFAVLEHFTGRIVPNVY